MEQGKPEYNFEHTWHLMYSNIATLYDNLKQRSSQEDVTEGPDFISTAVVTVDLIEKCKTNNASILGLFMNKNHYFVFVADKEADSKRLYGFNISKGFEYAHIELSQSFNFQAGEIPITVKGQYFEKESKVYLCVEVGKIRMEAIQRGTTRYLYLAMFACNSETKTLNLVAQTRTQIDHLQLSTLSNFAAQFRLGPKDPVSSFIKIKGRVFSIFRPNAERLPCILVHVVYKNQFVPITRNCTDYPGLFVFKDTVTLIRSLNSKPQYSPLYLANYEGNTEDGFTEFTVARILLKF